VAGFGLRLGGESFHSGCDSRDASLRAPLTFPARRPQTEAKLNVQAPANLRQPSGSGSNAPFDSVIILRLMRVAFGNHAMKIYRNTFAVFGIIVVAVLTAPFNLLAATNGFIVPFFRGSNDSQYGYWETFSVPYGSPGNLPDQPGATTSAILTQTNTNAFLTGSGNIYNLATSSFTLADPTPVTLGTVVLQPARLAANWITTPSRWFTRMSAARIQSRRCFATN